MTHVPTAASKAEVSALRSFGHTHEDIASHLHLKMFQGSGLALCVCMQDASPDSDDSLL